jgi:hypothetical protein
MIDVRASGGSEDEVEGGVWWYFLSFDSLSLLPFAFKSVLDRFTLSISGRGQGSELKHPHGTMTLNDERGQDNTDHETENSSEHQQRQHTEPADDERNQLFEQAFHDLQGVEELGGYPSEPVGPLTTASAIDPAIDNHRVDEFPASSITTETPTSSSPARKRRNGGKGHGQTLTKRNDDNRNEISSSTSGLVEAQGTTRNSSSGAGPSTAKSAGNVDTPSKYTNKEQLALLRQFYLENPTPTKAQIIELANTTGRPWSKVKEYFRQRRNKLRGVDEAGLDGMEEPDRATSWYAP